MHADLLQLPGPNPTTRLANADVAFSGAAANTGGLGTPINNEMQNAVSPSLANKDAYGRGSGLEVGLGTSLPNNPDANQAIIAGLAEAAAPPPTSLVTKEVGPIKGDPLIYASLLRGQAQAKFGPTPVSVTDPSQLAFGLGYGANVELVDQGTANPDGSMSKPTIATNIGNPTDRAAVQAKSFLRLVPNPGNDGTFGLVSETHETFAPITLFKGTPNELRIELLGEWVLRATATGKLGGATVTYAPAGNPTPTTPLISITPPGSPTQIILKTQDLFGPGKVPQHIDLQQLGSINIGEDPRAIGDDTASPGPASQSGDGTLASGAVDVVRIKLLVPDPTSHLADVRIGHMEAQANVPAGGVKCAAPPPPTTTSTTAPPTSTSSTTSTSTTTTSTTTPPSSTTTSTTAPSTTTTTSTSTTSTSTSTTSTTVFRGGPGTTTTTEPPTTTSTVRRATTSTTSKNPSTSTSTTTSTTTPIPKTAPAQPQVLAQSFTQSPPAAAVSQTPNFTG